MYSSGYMRKKVTRYQYSILESLLQNQACTVKDVACELQVSQSAATKSLSRLERKGMIKRVQDMIDRRRVNIHLTENGVAMLRFPGRTQKSSSK